MAALNNLAYRISLAGKADAAIALVTEALELAQRIGDRHREAALYNHLADLHHRSGYTTESEAAQLAAVRIFSDLEPGELEPEIWLLSQW
jgi:tetratricopeptide (TPR) repeat protein